jgi:hypothetical protein
MDCEGEPVQELSAIAMNNWTYQIVSVYHQHANCDPNVDQWARKHIHGLNLKYLQDYGFSCESALLIDFKRWLAAFNVIRIFCNNPGKERKVFPNLIIDDILLPPWDSRVNQHYHEVTKRFKDLCVPILSVRCSSYVHNQCFFPPYLNTAKVLYGYHCSLYDSYQLYLFYLFQTIDL